VNADLRGAMHVAAVWQDVAQETKLSRVRRVRAGTATLNGNLDIDRAPEDFAQGCENIQVYNSAWQKGEGTGCEKHVVMRMRSLVLPTRKPVR
jgi:hypothetical protein